MDTRFPKSSLHVLLAEAGAPGEHIYGSEAGALRVVPPSGETMTPDDASTALSAAVWLLRSVPAEVPATGQQHPVPMCTRRKESAL